MQINKLLAYSKLEDFFFFWLTVTMDSLGNQNFFSLSWELFMINQNLLTFFEPSFLGMWMIWQFEIKGYIYTRFSDNYHVFWDLRWQKNVLLLGSILICSCFLIFRSKCLAGDLTICEIICIHIILVENLINLWVNLAIIFICFSHFSNRSRKKRQIHIFQEMRSRVCFRMHQVLPQFFK